MIRTDLAVEAHETAVEQGRIDGVTSQTEKVGEVTVTTVRVLNAQGEKSIGKPAGTYVTIESGNLSSAGDEFEDAIKASADALLNMLQPFGNGPVLVAGLGNAAMTPDALGPRCIEKIFVTRHVAGELSRISGFENLRPVAAISPGVLGQTGVETGEILKAVVQRINPVAVIVIDALASRRATRLGNTVQLADTGIIPGSGIGNTRFAINRESLGVPVLSLGVPTVVDAATLAIDVLEGAGISAADNEEKIRSSIDPGGISLFVTPRMIDLIVEHAALLVGSAINRALNPQIPPEDIEKLVS